MPSPTPSRSTPAPALPGRNPLLAELASGELVSGRLLAARLGVSRAAIWKQIECLRAQGLPVSAQAGAGYRLDAAVDWLDAERIVAALPAAARAQVCDCVVHWQIDSTSDELLRRTGSDPRDLLVCVAETQSAGRGRRGRRWQAPLGGAIALSLLKRFDAGMAPLAGLSLVVGVAVARALAACGVAGIGLKWPNDLVAGGAKLGGILVELGGDAIGPCHAVIGIGVNVRLAAAAIAAIDQPCIDLAALCAGVPPPRNALAAAIIAALCEALERFAASGFAAFVDDYADLDSLRGRKVRVLGTGPARDGVARGVDARGALRVAFADGEACLDSAEVSVRA